MNTWIPGFYTVPEGTVAIVERYGKYDSTMHSGLHFINPFTCSIKDMSDWEGLATKCDSSGRACLIELTDQLMEMKDCKCHTKDHVSVDTNFALHYKIVSNTAARYGVDVLPDSLKDVCTESLRSKIGKVNFDEVLAKRHEISQQVMGDLQQRVTRWGIKILGFEVGELKFDAELENAMKQRRIAEAQRDKAKIDADTNRIQAESDAVTTLVRAKANADQQRVINETEIEYVNKLTDRLGTKGSVQIVTAEKIADAFSEIAANPNAKTIMIPSDYKGMLKLVDGK